MRKLTALFLIILVSGISGVLASQFLAPYLAHTSPFNQISWLKKVNNGTTIINRKEEKIIKEDTAIEDAISKISSSVVGIISKSTAVPTAKKPVPKAIYGTGFIVTSDGLVMAASSTAPEKSYEYSVVRDGAALPAEVVRRDDKTGLILLKVQQSNMPVVSFADTDSIKLGERIILFGFNAAKNPSERFVNWGIVKILSEKGFQMSIGPEALEANGAPIIDVEGKVAGMALVNGDGEIRTVPADAVKRFLSQ